MTNPIRAALLDLDGTLLDTVEDMLHAGNAMLRQAIDAEPLRFDDAAAMIGKGSRNFVERAFAVSSGQPMDAPVDQDQVEKWFPVFMHHYRVFNGKTARRYPGVAEGLAVMRARGLKLAVVTNKPSELVRPLLERFQLAHFFDAFVGGGDTPQKKPDPQPLRHACALMDVALESAVMIGDSMNDALAGRNAGCKVLLLPYGYNEGHPVESLEADAIVPTLLDAALWIDGYNAAQ
ncbi:phosphoglycolate phosphatase [Derxia gummosa]|uniref:Phosphoglycolate phosphatase n=1 Tax=Derxia gummosa DSM 723 TaxID=1121388 RepID=A0A8B6X5V4_9BURK|nr:phosphoglycolate phosphatase [Derxia gummosa]